MVKAADVGWPALPDNGGLAKIFPLSLSRTFDIKNTGSRAEFAKDTPSHRSCGRGGGGLQGDTGATEGDYRRLQRGLHGLQKLHGVTPGLREVDIYYSGLQRELQGDLNGVSEAGEVITWRVVS